MEKLKLDKIYEKYEAEYKNVFRYISPIENAERFTEENQTLNFYNAVRAVYPETVAWFEYPWKVDGVTFGKEKNSSNRFDAVIYIEDINTLLIVEAKCLRYDSKYEAINNDFCRILGYHDKHNNGMQRFTTKEKIKIHTKEFIPTKVYAVILADYWYKPKATKYVGIQNFWNDDYKSKSNYQLFDYFKNNVYKAYNNGYIENPDWEVLPKDKNNFPDKYYLLTMIGEIKDSEEIYTFNCKG